MDYSHIRPARSCVLIRPTVPPDKVGKIFLPAARKKPIISSGTVLRIAFHMEEDIQPGDVVLFEPFMHHEIKDWYEPLVRHFFIVHENNCLLVIRDW